MKRIVFWLVSFSLFVLLFGACQPPAATEETTPEIMLNLTSDATTHPHSSLMGLHFGMMALNNGFDLTVFLNVDGVKLMQAGADTISFHGENLHELLNTVMEKGGTLLGCPHCMEVHGVTEADLMEGVEVSSENVLMGKLGAGPTVLTY